MKKILLATTLLAGSAGFAAADVAVSGEAFMGVSYDGYYSESYFQSRVRIKFAATGTTDGGLAFGANVRADQDGGNSNTYGNNSSTVFISGAFGKLTFGDTGNAVDSLVGQVSGVGIGIADALDGAANIDMVDDAYKTAVDYSYSAGNLSFEIGAGQLNAGNDYKSVAVSYNAGAYTVAIGYEDDGTYNAVSAKGTATFGATTVKLKLADQSWTTDLSYAISADYVMGASTITAFYADDNYTKAVMGLGVAYDLGGGAVVKAGVVNDGYDTYADAGVTMKF